MLQGQKQKQRESVIDTRYCERVCLDGERTLNNAHGRQEGGCIERQQEERPVDVAALHREVERVVFITAFDLDASSNTRTLTLSVPDQAFVQHSSPNMHTHIALGVVGSTNESRRTPQSYT